MTLFYCFVIAFSNHKTEDDTGSNLIDYINGRICIKSIINTIQGSNIFKAGVHIPNNRHTSYL